MANSVRKLLIFLILWPTLSLSSELDCTPVRLDQNGGSMAQVKVRNQRGSKTCYAQSAAILLEAYMRSHPHQLLQNFESSAIIAALGSRKQVKTPDDPLKGGDVCQVLNYIRENGACDPIAHQSNGSPADDLEFLDSLTQYHRDVQDFRTMVRGQTEISPQALDQKALPLVQVEAQNIRCAMNAQWTPANGVPSVKVIREALSQEDLLAFLKAIMIRPNCAGHTFWMEHYLPECHNKVPTSGGLEGLLQAQWSQPNPQPVAIAFCSAILTAGKSYHRTGSGLPSLEELPSCGPHSSIILGRRKSHGKCQVLLQNHWGPNGCDFYHSDWKGHCEQGKNWIDLQVLEKYIYGYSSF
ncbi:hypothetical protein WDW37_17565 [Bdellovibrionota bacterium FG-1]